jgi:hypothetical protein
MEGKKPTNHHKKKNDAVYKNPEHEGISSLDLI